MQLSSIEQIRNDLENDDIFTLVYRGAAGTDEDNHNDHGSATEEEKSMAL